MTLQSVNPRTGAKFGPVFGEMSKEEVAKVIARAQLAHAKWSVGHPTQRQKAIYAIADAIDLHVTELVEVADLETGLGKVRLTGEVGRTTFQLLLAFWVAIPHRHLLPVVP
jgi:NADP-dependent aldehyde dehydrogenase